MRVLKFAGAALLVLLGLLLFWPVLVIVGASGPLLATVAVVSFSLLVLWFLFGRRRASSILAGSETSLMGRQSSKEGLL